MKKHTSTPWKAEILEETVLRLEGPDTYSFQANIPLILRAVNSHEELMEALKAVYEKLEQGEMPTPMWHEKAKQAIAKAEGK